MNTSIKAIVLESTHEGSPCVEVWPGQELTVGRARNVDYSVPTDKLMSREHFSISFDSNRAVLRDLISTNGTVVNGRPVVQTTVYDGDQVTAGSTTFWVRFLIA